MTSHYRHLRTSNPTKAFPSPVDPGEIVANTANRQLAIGDADAAALGAPLVLLAIRIFDARAQYAAGDFVVQAGALYRAKGAVVPNPFNASQWDLFSTDVTIKAYADAGDAAVTAAFQNADAAITTAYQGADTALQTNINAKTDKAYVDAADALKADKTYVDSQNTTQDTTITGKVAKAGDTMSGALIVTPKGSLFGGASGAPATGAVTPADANIKLYDFGAGNWAGFGVDNNGNLWLRTGLNGTPAPAFWVDTNQLLNLQKDPTAALGAATKQYVDSHAAPFDAMAYNGLQINGGMEVSQEHGSTPVAATGGFTYACDGWALQKSGTMAFTGGPLTGFFSNFLNYLNVAVTTAQASLGAGDMAMAAQHSIEGYRLGRLAWGTANAQPITLGFWTAHARPGLYSVSLRTATGSRSYVATYTQNAGNALEYKTITIPGDIIGTWPVDNTTGLTISFNIGCGTTYTAPAANSWQAGNYLAAPGQVNAVAATSDIFRLTGFTVHPGNTGPNAARSPFIMRSYDQELMICKRYYYKRFTEIATYGPAGGAMGQWFAHPVTMRAAPTVSFAGGSLSNASNTQIDSITPDGFRGLLILAALGAGYMAGATTLADARL